jgi:hypothetical protein
MSPAGFEPAFPANGRPQTYAPDRVATTLFNDVLNIVCDNYYWIVKLESCENRAAVA